MLFSQKYHVSISRYSIEAIIYKCLKISHALYAFKHYRHHHHYLEVVFYPLNLIIKLNKNIYMPCEVKNCILLSLFSEMGLLDTAIPSCAILCINYTPVPFSSMHTVKGLHSFLVIQCSLYC